MYRLFEWNGTEVLEISSGSDLLRFGGVEGSAFGDIAHFKNLFQFDGVISIRQGVPSAKGMFCGYKSLNCPVTLPYGLISCEDMFAGCDNFNFPIHIPESVANCKHMFRNCIRFNQPVEIPYGVQSCAYMFYGCINFNQPLIIPQTVDPQVGSYEILGECYRFNSPILFENEVSLRTLKGCLDATSLQPEDINIYRSNLAELLQT